MESRPVAITGLGAVSGLGPDVAAHLAGLRSGANAVGRLTRFAYAGRSGVAAEAVVEAPGAVLAGTKSTRLSHADLLALSAAREATADASLDATERSGAMLVVGSTTGGMRETERHYDRRATGAIARYRLSVLAATPLSAPTDVVALELGIHGPRRTVSTACSSSALAIGLAADAIRRGVVTHAVAVGTDQLCRLTYAGFDALHALDPAPCRPFDAARGGLSLGEGAAALVLESVASARARGRRPHAVVRGWGTSSDAHHTTAPDPEGRGAVRAIERALADASLAPEAVDYVNAHGSATQQNDAVEMQALGAVLGARLGAIPISSSKSQIGHCLGAAGALEAVVTVLALAHGVVPPTLRLETPDAAWADVDLVPAPGRQAALGSALSASYGFGGHNVVLCFAREDA